MAPTTAAAAVAAADLVGLGETAQLEGLADEAGDLADDAIEGFLGIHEAGGDGIGAQTGHLGVVTVDVGLGQVAVVLLAVETFTEL